jgi:ribonuclease HI
MNGIDDRLFDPRQYGWDSSVNHLQIIKANRSRRFYNIRHPRRGFHANIIGLYTGGSCSRNGYPDAEGGVGVYFGRRSRYNVSQKLSNDNDSIPTSSRAELYSAIAALRVINRVIRPKNNGINTFIILADSTYLVNGITEYINWWKVNGWVTRAGKPVINQDLWVELDDTLQEMQSSGFDVLFWKCPRSENDRPHQLARRAVRRD